MTDTPVVKTATVHNHRPEFVLEGELTKDFGVVEQPLTIFERLYNNGFLRKLGILLIIGAIWEVYAQRLNNPLLVPTLSATLQAFWEAIAAGELPGRVATSVRLLLQGYGTGLLLAFVFTTLAITTRIGNDLLELLTSMFNPLPAIALLPLALIWFGLGDNSIIFVVVHSVLWAVALNTHSGFRSVSNTMRMVGRNYGLGGLRLVFKVLIPAAFPSILTGLKIGWAFAWRTLIAAELVYGAASGKGGLGWFIYEAKNQLEIPAVFAGLFAVILIGLFIENVVFRFIEGRTVRKWGMQT
ncbi:MAG: ABC transporter permease [Hyphomicrobiaceae bacterium]